MTHTALIIDDEPDIRELVSMSLTRIGLDTHTAANLEEARNLIDNYAFDVCLTDMRLPDGNGIDFVGFLKDTQPQLPVAVMTAHGDMTAAVEAMKNGAYDFVSKPVDINLLRRLVTEAISFNHDDLKIATGADHAPDNKAANNDTVNDAAGCDDMAASATVGNQFDTAGGGASVSRISDPQESENADNNADKKDPQTGTPLESSETAGAADEDPASLQSLSQRHEKTAIPGLSGGEQLIGRSDAMQHLRIMIGKASRTNAPVWITGETGTGKELVARLIHQNSSRADQNFVAINCGAIPTELMESELFGHRKGSFSGASADHDGLFVRADAGTLFLDEIAELPLHMQVKLLRAIQERSIRPVGSSQEISTNVRILSASHANLGSEVEAGRFRHDLYYRLNVICLRSPNLRDRLGDIGALCDHILARHVSNNEHSSKSRLDASALQLLTNYTFPGNVRELENLIERAVAMSDADTITADDIDIDSDGDTEQVSNHHSGNRNLSNRHQGLHAEPQAQDIKGMQENGMQTRGDESDRIRSALTETRWNRKAAARQLGLTYRQLRYRIHKLGIDDPD